MTEQQPVEGTTATPAPEGEKPAEGSQEAPATRNAEEVEAEYKARLSGKDRAHAAEVATLKSQIEALSGEKAQATSQAEGTLSEVDQLKRQLSEAQKNAKQQEQQYTATLRSTKYPYAAEALDPQVLATMDEGKLAGLDARLKPNTRPGAGVDPSTPPRETAAPKPIDEKSAAELKQDLARFGPAFADDINANR